MPLNRRDILKTLLMSPFFGLAGKLPASAMSGFTPGTLNVLLNGLFFMELDNSDPTNPKLLIHAPKLTDHDFVVGTRDNLQTSTGFDWSTGFGLTGGRPTFNQSQDIPDQVPTSILQFTKKETGFSALQPDNGSGNLYFGTVTLPWPKNSMISLRPDNFPPFDPGTAQTPKNVAPKIMKRCRTSQIGNIICIQYECTFSGPVLPPASPVMNVHLDMRCCDDNAGTPDHINTALAEAAGVFQPDPQNPGSFDLQLQKNAHIVKSPFEPQPQLPGVPLEEERAPNEDPGGCPNMPVLAISSVKNPLSKAKKRQSTAAIQGQGTVSAANVSPANCPALFLG
jgi:hypothetical protein